MKLDALAQVIGARLIGDGALDVTRVRAIDEAGEGDLGFAADPRELRLVSTTKATAVLVPEGFAAEHAHELDCAVLCAEPASRALASAIEALYPQPHKPEGISERAVVDKNAKIGAHVTIGACAVIEKASIGARVKIGALAYVGEDVVIGDESIIGVGAVVLPGARIGARVVVGPGSVIGDEGFVYAPDQSRNVRVRHVAGVVIDDDAEIGANACVDRGALRDTHVGRGTKVDNLAQIGHDVVVGEDAVIVAQVGIAGDARVGDAAVLAGQAGVKERAVIGNGARVGGQAGVIHDIEPGQAVMGTPAIPHLTWLRMMTRLREIDALEKRVRALETRE
jgi:UDP-3-O-[3-hydroxymyristoyl] glucosamine N-acyltransferase